jgi:hypothetical protein
MLDWLYHAQRIGMRFSPLFAIREQAKKIPPKREFFIEIHKNAGQVSLPVFF